MIFIFHSFYFRIGKFHENMITNIIIDKSRNYLISFDTSTNIFVWDIENNIVNKLSGHTNSVTGI